jgi:hypothetical protein
LMRAADIEPCRRRLAHMPPGRPERMRRSARLMRVVGTGVCLARRRQRAVLVLPLAVQPAQLMRAAGTAVCLARRQRRRVLVLALAARPARLMRAAGTAVSLAPVRPAGRPERLTPAGGIARCRLPLSRAVPRIELRQ